MNVDDFDYWRLCDELSILQAALLISGQNPSGENCHVEKWQINERPLGYEAAKTALINGLKRKVISGELSYIYVYDEGYEQHVNTGQVDIDASIISVDSLKAFLKQKEFYDGFFFRDVPDTPNYLNLENPCYAPKLAAACKAWEAVTSDESLTRTKTPKQALEKWLKEHANEFDLTDADGDPIKGAIDQIAKVANWKPEGGAAKTPNLQLVQSNLKPLKKTNIEQEDQSMLDDEIPF